MKKDTIIATAGRRPLENHGVVNPPVYHASTIVFPSIEEFETRDAVPYGATQYGRTGTPTQFAFEEAVTALHGGDNTVAYPSGLAAIAGALTTFLQHGDHLLMVDSAYGPSRKRVADFVLARAGIEVTYYDPLIGTGIAEMIRPNTRMIFLESPGSLTFEVQDVPAITAVARENGILTAMDNTWSSGWFCRPLALGADLVVEAATKYVVGHSDAMLGTVTAASEEHFRALKAAANSFGYHAAPDDCYLGLRGLRTLGVRLERHQQNARRVAEWLAGRDEVARVMYPALPDDTGHELWRRDHGGASGLFGVILRTADKAAAAAMVDNLEHFGIGASWGGYESLVIPTYPAKLRTAAPWQESGFSIRLHIGLEDPDDLIADLDAGLGRLRKAGG